MPRLHPHAQHAQVLRERVQIIVRAAPSMRAMTPALPVFGLAILNECLGKALRHREP